MSPDDRLIYSRPAPAWPWRLVVAGAALGMTVLTALLVPLTDLLSAPPQPDIEYRTVELSDWHPPTPPPAPPPRPLPPAPSPSPQPARQAPRLEEPAPAPTTLRLPVKLDFALGAVRTDLTLDFTPDPTAQTIPATTPAGPVAPAPATAAAPAPPPSASAPPPERLDQPPAVLSQPKPTYPYSARTRRIEGYVDVQFTVTVQGRVEDVTILGADPRNVFEEAAVAGVSRWLFSPARRSGQAVAARLQVRICFTLEDP